METNFFPAKETGKLKSYWSRPGGKFGVLVGLGALGVAAYYLIPVLTRIIWNTLNFSIALLCLGLFLYMVTHRKLRLAFFYFYEWLMKKMVGLVIELDPFVISEDYIEDMEKQREKLYQQSIDVDAQKERIDLKLREKEQEINHLSNRAKAAQSNGMMPELGNATRQISRIHLYIKQLAPLRDNLARIGEYLSKVHKNSGYLIEDARNELELKKDLYKSVSSGNRALNSALRIFKGDPEKRLMVEQSMEFLKEDIAGKLASMKKAISYSTDFMRSIDLDNATYEVEGLKMLETYDPDTEWKLNSTERKSKENVSLPGKVDLSGYADLF